MGQGWEQLRTKPGEGFNNGIMQGATGIVKGGAGLAQHAVGGGAGSMARMTKAVNKPFTFLTMDDEFIHKKEMRDLKDLSLIHI